MLSLTVPPPSPLTRPDLIDVGSLAIEEDLAVHPDHLNAWIRYADTISKRPGNDVDGSKDSENSELLGPLATPSSQRKLEQLTLIYERALAIFPTSYKLWKRYLTTRQSFILGPLDPAAVKAHKANAGRAASTKLSVTHTLEFAASECKWTGGLDGTVGYLEWKSLVATGERAIQCLPHLPGIWLLHLTTLIHPLCPSVFAHTYARKTFDRALRTLPPSLHARIWGLYLLWAETRASPESCDRVWARLLDVDMELTERHVTQHLLDGDHPRPLRASKYLLAMIDRMQSGKWTSTEGKSVFQLITDWLELINEYAEEVGMDVEAEQEWKKNQQKETEQSATSEATEKPADGPLIRFEGAPVPIEQFKAASKTSGQSDTFLFPRDFTSPSSPTLLPVSHIVHMFLKLFSDQAGHLYTSLATYYIKLGDFATATSTFEHALETVVSIKDFTVVFDAYVEFEETVVSSLMAALDSGADEDDDEDDGPGLEAELDERMAHFEQLITRRPFLLNDVLLRRNPNEVVEWEKRVALYTTQDEEKAEIDAKIIDTYTRAMDAVNPKKAIGPLNTLIVNFAKFYETGGTAQDASPDLDSAREIFEKAVRIPFKTVDELAEVWIEYAELELRHENYSAALKLLQRATDTQGRSDRDVKKINFYDANVPVQTRLLKSLKLWSFYVDLEESIGSVASTTAIYDRILALKIASAQTIVNYAQFLSSQAYHEESFKIYERGIDLFSFPVAYELWNLYLSAFITRYKGSKLERARDLFEQALESCPEKYCKDIFLMYAQLEEEYGLGRRAMAIYERAVSKVQSEDRMEMFTIYIAKAATHYGLPSTRPIYQQAIATLPDAQTVDMCLRFASLERKLGEIDRARAIYAHASQFCDPRSGQAFWAEWNAFEIDHGSEDTFREMLRIKRSVQAAFNTEASYIAAQAQAARQGLRQGTENQAADEFDPMAAIERENAAATTSAPSFVRSNTTAAGAAPATDEDPAAVVNPDAITMQDLDDDSDDE